MHEDIQLAWSIHGENAFKRHLNIIKITLPLEKINFSLTYNSWYRKKLFTILGNAKLPI